MFDPEILYNSFQYVYIHVDQVSRSSIIQLRLFLTDFILDVARDTGIVLDPVYTGKAVQGLLKELRDRPSQFAGKRILFIHTGNYRSACHHAQ